MQLISDLHSSIGHHPEEDAANLDEDTVIHIFARYKIMRTA